MVDDLDAFLRWCSNPPSSAKDQYGRSPDARAFPYSTVGYWIEAYRLSHQ